jgi:sensor domain CHASE-containing protein
MKDYAISMLCMIAGLGYGLAFYFALEMSESRNDKQRAIAELTEVRVMAEWDRFEEGRGE